MRRWSIVRIAIAGHLVVAAIFSVVRWGDALTGADQTARRAWAPVEAVSEAIKAYPENARCLLISDQLPWEIAYAAAPRLLYRYKGESEDPSGYLKAADLDCVIFSLKDGRTGVFNAGEKP